MRKASLDMTSRAELKKFSIFAASQGWRASRSAQAEATS